MLFLYPLTIANHDAVDVAVVAVVVVAVVVVAVDIVVACVRMCFVGAGR